MTFEWNSHRFSGGVLALDLVNTVVYRQDRQRSHDRMASIEDVNLFASAAARFRAKELGATSGILVVAQDGFSNVVRLRESINGYFRHAKRLRDADLKSLGELLQICGDAIGTGPEMSLMTQVALSAIRLVPESARDKIKICPGCYWLFLDSSRNGSRLWCDMAVCGNRHKARLNYLRKRQGLEPGVVPA
jgi:predicted RNA-binding Zn ribbon-like protein